MASVVIPPWLETKPSDFAAASEAGSRLGLEQRGQDINQEETRARLAQSAQEIAANYQEQAMKVQAAKQIAQNNLALKTQLAARKFQQQQAYQQSIASGMDPIQAMMVHGPGMGQSMAGVGSLGLAQTRERMAALPPQFVQDPNDPKRTLGVTYGGQFHPAALPRPSASTKPSVGAQARLKAAVAAVAAATKIGLPDQIKEAQDKLDQIAEEVDNPEAEGETGDESGGAGTPQNESDPLGLFSAQ